MYLRKINKDYKVISKCNMNKGNELDLCMIHVI